MTVPMTRRRLGGLAAIGLSLIMLGGGGYAYTNWSISQQDKAERANDQRWCKLLTTLDEAYRATPPQSPTGQRLAADIHNLRAELGCG
jgi:hypothetical protein